MNHSTPTSSIVPAVYGIAFEGGFYGGQIRIHTGIFSIAWAPKDQGDIKGIWLPRYDDVPGATSCFDSMANTRAMAEAGSPLAQLALAADINGHKDWCIPARDVLEMGYRYLKPGTQPNCCSFRDGDNASSIPAGYPYTADQPAQTADPAFQTGGTEAFAEDVYISSTQYDADYAFNQSFGYGYTYLFSKKFEACARLARLIQIA